MGKVAIGGDLAQVEGGSRWRGLPIHAARTGLTAPPGPAPVRDPAVTPQPWRSIGTQRAYEWQDQPKVSGLLQVKPVIAAEPASLDSGTPGRLQGQVRKPDMVLGVNLGPAAVGGGSGSSNGESPANGFIPG